MKCKVIFRTLPSEWKKREMNLEPQLEVTCNGTLCFEKTWSMNRQANSMEFTSLVIGIKIPCFINLSTTTKIVVKLELSGSCSMKSIKMKFNGFLGIGSCLSIPYGLCQGAFTLPQVVQDLQKSDTNPQSFSQV